jgi:phage baseplate assembly protein W
MMELGYPFRFDGKGLTATAAEQAHIRDLIEQVLFTSPGERVNRPTFGSGLLKLVFAPNGDVLAAAAQVSAQGALQQWLGDVITVQALDVDNSDATLSVTVRYLIRRTQQPQVATFTGVAP